MSILVGLLALEAQAGRSEDNALLSAIMRSDEAAAAKALKNGANPQARMLSGETALGLAEKKGLSKTVELLKTKSVQTAPAQPQTPPPVVAAPAKEPAVAPAAPIEEVKPEPVQAEEPPAPAAAEKVEAPQAAPTPQEPPREANANIQAMLDSKILLGDYNGIVVDFLVKEGKNKLSPDQRQQALDQLVAALKEKTQVSKDEQLTMALGTLVGIGMGAANDDVVSDAGSSVESSYASEWATWVDAAFNLIHAGYAEEAANFFQFGLQHIPYPELKAECVKGLAQARPNEAYNFLMAATAKPTEEEVNTALRLLGYLAASGTLSKEKQDAVIGKLIEFSQGMLHTIYFRAAIYGLDVSGDPRAVEALSRFKKGLGIASEDRRPALRSLLLTYHDNSVVGILEGMTKGGFVSLNNPYDQLFAARLLIEAGNDTGFQWAQTKLEKTAKGFFDSKDEPDFRPDIVRILVEHGGEKGLKVLKAAFPKYKNGDWLQTWIATGMLELGDKTEIQLVRASLNNPSWDYTAVRIAEALAKHGDYSGIPALQDLIEKRPPKKSAGMQVLSALAGEKDKTPDENRRLADLRIQIANGLARINRPECAPLLAKLLGDENYYVRSTAALALTELTRPDALSGLSRAMKTDFGLVNQRSRNPEIWAHVVRLAAMRFPENATTLEIVNQGAQEPSPSVQFLSAVLQQ
ncbi:MAG TPA: hypothetical protein DCZ95_03085 [Verrucomicrobia bacterium]|nr:MAG: hypothetical protein A2X46_02330 [Lentisphaerae bacterium GWF2_57_35]HBA83057.1 hypothetical protein [Verrucomicrobiota bacterium]